MKKHLLSLFFAIFILAGLNAQTILYLQDFENTGGVIPTEITLINADGRIPADADDAVFADSAWIVGTSGRPEFAGTHLAIACSYYEDINLPADDWMIMPSVTIGNNTSLTWDAMSLTSSGNWPDEYQVLVAPSAEGITPTKAYFEENGVLLFQIIESCSAACSSTPGQGLMHRTLNLSDSGFAGVPVWIAFRLVTAGEGGAYIGIDNIKVEETLSVNTSEKQNVSVYPNPASEFLFVYFNGNEAQVQLFDVTGKMLRNLDQALNGSALNVSGIAKGLYILRVKSGNQIFSQKVMIK